MPSRHPEIDATIAQIVRFKLDLLLGMNLETLPPEIRYFQCKQGIRGVFTAEAAIGIETIPYVF